MMMARPTYRTAMSSAARLGRVLRPPSASDHSQGASAAAATAAHSTFCLTTGASAVSAMNGYHGATATIAIAQGNALSPSIAIARIASRATHTRIAVLGS